MNEYEDQTYKSTGTPRHAVLVLSPATYEPSWGTQTMDGPHMKISEPAGEGHYPCALDVFLETYEDAGMANAYRKVTTVVARRLKKARDVKTLEGVEHANAGDWLVTNQTGEQYPIADEVFRKLYQPAAS